MADNALNVVTGVPVVHQSQLGSSTVVLTPLNAVMYDEATNKLLGHKIAEMDAAIAEFGGGGGTTPTPSLDIYSSDEQVCGAWIDRRYVYWRTIEGTIPQSATVNAQAVLADISSWNLDSVITSVGCIDNGGAFIPSDQTTFNIWFTSTGIYFQGAADYRGYRFRLVVKYLKTNGGLAPDPDFSIIGETAEIDYTSITTKAGNALTSLIGLYQANSGSGKLFTSANKGGTNANASTRFGSDEKLADGSQTIDTGNGSVQLNSYLAYLTIDRSKYALKKIHLKYWVKKWGNPGPYSFIAIGDMQGGSVRYSVPWCINNLKIMDGRSKNWSVPNATCPVIPTNCDAVLGEVGSDYALFKHSIDLTVGLAPSGATSISADQVAQTTGDLYIMFGNAGNASTAETGTTAFGGLWVNKIIFEYDVR